MTLTADADPRMTFTAQLGRRVSVIWQSVDDADPRAELGALAEFIDDLIWMLDRDPEPPLVVLAARVGSLTETVGGLRNDVGTLLEQHPPAGAS